MDEEEIVERGLIAYCIMFFSEHVMLDIVVEEQLKQKEKDKRNGG
jgi:hypothetical protein